MSASLPTSSRKQCIELEQQFDFLKDLVALVPHMLGDGEDNHMHGDKGPRRGQKPGNRDRKNGGMGSKGKDKKLSGTDSEQENESEDTDTDGEEETPQQPAQPATLLLPFRGKQPQHLLMATWFAGWFPCHLTDHLDFWL